MAKKKTGGAAEIRYRPISVCIHSDEKFRKLSKAPPNGQTLWMHLLSCKEGTSLPGLMSLGEAQLAEDLGWPIDGFREVWKELEKEGMARADWEAQMVWLPNAIHHSPPANPNMVTSWGRLAREVPECPLRTQGLRALLEELEARPNPSFAAAFRAAFRAFPDVLAPRPPPQPAPEPFREPTLERFPEPFEEPFQEPFQEPFPKPIAIPIPPTGTVPAPVAASAGAPSAVGGGELFPEVAAKAPAKANPQQTKAPKQTKAPAVPKARPESVPGYIPLAEGFGERYKKARPKGTVFTEWKDHPKEADRAVRTILDRRPEGTLVDAWVLQVLDCWEVSVKHPWWKFRRERLSDFATHLGEYLPGGAAAEAYINPPSGGRQEAPKAAGAKVGKGRDAEACRVPGCDGVARGLTWKQPVCASHGEDVHAQVQGLPVKERNRAAAAIVAAMGAQPAEVRA